MAMSQLPPLLTLPHSFTTCGLNIQGKHPNTPYLIIRIRVNNLKHFLPPKKTTPQCSCNCIWQPLHQVFVDKCMLLPAQSIGEEKVPRVKGRTTRRKARLFSPALVAHHGWGSGGANALGGMPAGAWPPFMAHRVPAAMPLQGLPVPIASSRGLLALRRQGFVWLLQHSEYLWGEATIMNVGGTSRCGVCLQVPGAPRTPLTSSLPPPIFFVPVKTNPLSVRSDCICVTDTLCASIYRAYIITDFMGIRNESFMKVAAVGTWMGDFVTAWMVRGSTEPNRKWNGEGCSW